MIAFFLQRPTTTLMVYLALVLIGIISFRNLAIEGQPDTELPQLVITAAWPNTPPEVIQVFLTSPIEEVAAQLEGMEEMTSSSTTRGGCEVTLKFNRQTDMEFVRLDLNERLSKLRTELPPGASQPTISSVTRDDTTNTALLSLTVSGPYDLQVLSEIVEDDLATALGAVQGVGEVYIYGTRTKELKVQLNRSSMDLLGLVPERILARITELSRTYETARVRFDNREMTVTISNSIPNLETVGDLVVRQQGDRLVRVRDVAEVSIGYADLRSLSRLNGNPTLSLNIEREMGANPIETAKLIRKTLDQLLATLPAGIRVDWQKDEGRMMEEQLDAIYVRSLWCLALIAILLLIFLRSLSAAMIITLNILFSTLITINFMYFFDVTVNVVTLSGLAIGFGMLVDNAIVVLENTFRLREEGLGRKEAALEGARQVVWPILAATLTTVASFICMFGLKDRLAAVYGPMVLPVVFSLSSSMLVSFTFTPLLGAFIRGSGIRNSGKANAFQKWSGHLLERFCTAYEQAVTLLLRHKLTVLTILCLGAWHFHHVYKSLDRGNFAFFRNSQSSLMVWVRMPEGAELNTADEVIRQFEEPLARVPGYKDRIVRVNQNFASMEVTFDQETLRSSVPLVLKSRLIGIAQGFAGVSMAVMGITSDDNYFSGFTGMESYNSSIRLLGYNYKQLVEYSQEILNRIKRNRRVKETNIRTQQGRRASDQTETVLVIDRNALRHHAIDIQYLLSFLSSNLRMESRTYTRLKGEEVPLQIKFDNADSFDIKDLEELTIRTSENSRIRLVDLVHLETRTVPGGIGRKDQQFMVELQWDYRGTSRKAEDYRKAVFASLQLPPGYTAELEFTSTLSEVEEDNFQQVLLLAILLVFLILAALYESFVDPFVILLTIPIGFMGVVWIYQTTGKPLDSTAWVGLIILAGIVVNNSILLIAHINEKVLQAERAGSSIHAAIAAACKDRLRPILLTALTTLIGLLPLLDEFVRSLQALLLDLFDLLGMSQWGTGLLKWFSGNEGEQANQGLDMTIAMFSSLSRSTVGGMISATLGTLLISPVLYLVFFRLKQWLNQRIAEMAGTYRGTTNTRKAGHREAAADERQSSGANLL